MESIWKMELSLKEISLTWDDPWKKYEERWKKKPRRGKTFLYSDISRLERPFGKTKV